MFSLFVSIRNTLYGIGIIKQIHSPFPVISIGNISVGGTGKTPITMMIARMCNELHIPISLLSIGIDTRGKHDKLLYKDLRVPIPRHHEISVGTTRAIFQAFEGHFGKDWWRND